MLINLMPNTHAYSFDGLFIFTHDNVFAPLMSGITNFNRGTVAAIANASWWELFSSADIVRSAVSLSTALIFLIQALPGIVSMGVVILYSKSLGAKRIDAAKKIWQNSLIATTLSGFIEFAILIILIPTVTPTQATSFNLSWTNVQSMVTSISTQLSNAGYESLFFNCNTYTLYTNDQEYFVPVLSNGHAVYLNITHNSLMSGHYTVANDPGKLTAMSFSTDSLLQSWNNYFEAVRNYSIKWAENFLFIMDVGLLLECFANIFIEVLRVEGEIKITTIITVLTIGINILLDYLFISVAQIGVEGAAIASVIGFVIQITLLACFVQFSKHAQCRFNDWRHLKVNWKLIGQFAKIGINNLVGVVGMTVTTILLTREITLVAGQLLPASGSEYYISIVGAIMPFVTLFFSSIGGFAKNTVQLFWMIQVPIFAFIVNAMVVFLVASRIKTAILVSLIRSVIVPIPMIYIWGAIAMHGFGTDLSIIPSENTAMWFFMTITPSYTAVYNGILFMMSTIFLYIFMFKKPTGKPQTNTNGLNVNSKPSSDQSVNSNKKRDSY